MVSTIRQHAGAGLVAAAVIIGAFAQGLFKPTGYAAASIVIWAAVIAGLVGRALPSAPVGRLAAVAGLCLGATARARDGLGRLGERSGARLQRGRPGLVLPRAVHVWRPAPRDVAGRAQWLAGAHDRPGRRWRSSRCFANLQPGVLRQRRRAMCPVPPGGSPIRSATGTAPGPCSLPRRRSCSGRESGRPPAGCGRWPSRSSHCHPRHLADQLQGKRGRPGRRAGDPGRGVARPCRRR